VALLAFGEECSGCEVDPLDTPPAWVEFDWTPTYEEQDGDCRTLTAGGCEVQNDCQTQGTLIMTNTNPQASYWFTPTSFPPMTELAPLEVESIAFGPTPCDLWTPDHPGPTNQHIWIFSDPGENFPQGVFGFACSSCREGEGEG
jgi:hypothetical protein